MKTIIISEKHFDELLQATLNALKAAMLDAHISQVENTTIGQMRRTFHYHVCRFAESLKDSQI